VPERLHTEKELLKRVAKGDETAFTRLFNNYRNKIYSIAFDFTESSAIAEEIVQDVFLKIWIRRDSLNSITHFSAYLFTITRNYMFTALKRIARRQNIESKAVEDAPLFDEDTEARLLHKEYATILQEAIGRLPSQQREVYLLIKEKGYKREEAASALQLSPETVKTHLAQAMRNIRAYCIARLDVFMLVIFISLFIKIIPAQA
jgi:RNA polymerase sigma-70 factor (ECF subfamily)